MAEKTSILDIRTTTEHLCNFGQKVAGTKAEIDAAIYIRDCLLSYGFTKVEMQPFDVHGWNPQSCKVRIVKPGQRELKSALFPYCKSESVNGVLAPIDWEVDEKESSSSSFGKGLIGFTEWGPDTYLSPRFTYFRAAKLGYEGLIVMAKDRGDLLKLVVLASGGLLKIPVICITKEEGESLRSMMKEGDVIVSIDTEVNVTDKLQSHNIVAILDGDGTTDEEVIVGAHYDSWFKGAADNCAQAAIVLELARIFQAKTASREVPKRTIRFLFYGAEESGTTDFYFWLNGSKAYVLNNKESVAKAVVVLSLDSTAFANPAIDYLYATGELLRFAESLKVEHGRARSLKYQTPPSYGSDHWFFELSGIPTIYGVSGVISEQDIAQPSPLYHTDKDDPEHLDYESLHFYAEFMNKALSYLSTTDLLPMDIFVPLKKFEEILSKYDKLQGNTFDLKPLLEKVKNLMKQNASFNKFLASIARENQLQEVAKTNSFLMRTVNGFNRTIGWLTRPIETYSVNYLSRLEMIEDYIHLTNAIKALRSIPIANFDSETTKRVESIVNLADNFENPYNWLRIHDSLANLEDERGRVGIEVQNEIASLSEFLDKTLTEIKELSNT
jgi:carboxypeptidase Q